MRVQVVAEVVLDGQRLLTGDEAPPEHERAALEAEPNVSEGRDAATIASIADAFSATARLLDVHTDPDHHRSVLTLAGEDDALGASLVAGVARSRDLIDLRLHEGVHPRVGAA